jgi:cell division protein FtsZ
MEQLMRLSILHQERTLLLFETEQALSEIRNATDRDLNIIYGTTVNQDLDDEMIVTVIATGYELKAKDSTD